MVTTKSIFSDDFLDIFDVSITPVLLDASSNEKEENNTPRNKQEWTSTAENTLTCSYCKVIFPNVLQQREHYRLDWHRYNLKQSLLSKVPIGEEEFYKKNENDDVSSISGSNTEEEDTLDTYAEALGKIFLQNKNGQVFSMYRCLLFDKKEEVNPMDLFKRFKEICYDNRQWTILMLGGGHFAGAVFKGCEIIKHKTFHCYTVRAGQGGSQSSRDNKSGGSHPKSAGASLRRYNEQALVDHVNNIVSTWSEDIKKSSRIIYRASGPYNRSVLFGGKEPLLDRSDKYLCTIPFSTGRATFAEVKRVHLLLSQAEVYDSLSTAANNFLKQKSPDSHNKRQKIRSSCVNRAKSRELVHRPLPTLPSSGSSSETDLTEPDPLKIKSDNPDDNQLNCEDLEISFGDLEEFGDSLTPEQRKRGHHNKKPKKSKNQRLKEKEEARKKNLLDILVKGNLIQLKAVLEERLKTFEEGTISKSEVTDEFINEILDEHGNSFLHIAAMNEHEEMLQFLLENGASPCLKNKNQQTPYSCTTSKVIRDSLRKFAKDHPDKYNYNKAQIPMNTLTEKELAEKRKTQKKVKREKEKEKKKENQIKQKEEDEKNRFLKLSDREKRALAAERRFLNSDGKISARCFLCGADIAGKVPFEYLENRFCSVDCLKAHRLKTNLNVS